MSSETVVPVVFWGNRPPTHKISRILITPNYEIVITGCRDGHICIWRFNNDQYIAERMLFGHSDSITSLTYISISNSAVNESFVSTAFNGEICLWNLNDGKCLECSLLPGKPSNVLAKSLVINGQNQESIICFGNFTEIVILNALNLKLFLTLSSKIYPDWISSVCLYQKYEKKSISVIGLTTGGVLKVWKIPTSLSVNIIHEDESRNVTFPNSLHISLSSSNLLLLVSTNSWQICDFDFSLLCSSPKNSNHQWLKGEFFQDDKFVLWTTKGDIIFFRLPFNPSTRELFRSSLNKDHSEAVETLKSCCILSSDQQLLPPVISFFKGSNNSDNFLVGDCTSCISIYQLNNESISLNLKHSSSFQTLWDSLDYQPIGIIDQLSHDMKDPLGVTSTVFIKKFCFLCCGREDGTIVIVPASKTCRTHLLQDKYSSRKGWPPHKTLRGHKNQVTCLVYPHEQAPDRYNSEILVSGGADFSVFIWDIFNSVMLYTFHIHNGPIQRLIVPPDQCNQRIRNSICAIGRESVSLLSLRDRKCIFLASCHPSPITSIHWRPEDDFLIVACSDLSVFVWQIETGHLDRYEEGSVAARILEGCLEVENNGTEDFVDFNFKISNAVKNKSVSAFKTIAHTNIKSFIEGKSGFKTKLNKPIKERSFHPITISSFRTNSNQDFDSHIAFFNSEDIISTLLNEGSEETQQAVGHETNKVQPQIPAYSPGIVTNLFQHVKNQFKDNEEENIEPNSYRVKNKKSTKLETDSTWDVAQILLSCLYAWGLDSNIDDSVESKLGIILPKHPICFGILSRENYMSLSLPHSVDDKIENSLVDASPWKASSLLTTQSLLSVISIANTMMELPVASFKRSRKTILRTANSEDTSDTNSINNAHIKQSWSLLTTLHCVLLPEKINSSSSYKSLNLEMLADRWQHRCLEIREASQALMLAQLNLIGTDGRRSVVRKWSQHLPDYMCGHVIGGEGSEQPIDSFLFFGNAAGAAGESPHLDSVAREGLIGEADSVDSRHSYETRRRHATSIVILGVIGAEFSRDLDQGSLIHNTSHALAYLLLKTPSARLPLHAPMRRAAIDLIGRGFIMWEPYMEVSAVLLALLDLCEHFATFDFHSSLALPPAADSCRSAHHALTLIATARPLTFVTTIAREVARHNAAAANPQHQALLQNSLLARARREVLRIIEQLIEKQFVELQRMLVEVVDIALFCIDTSQLRASYGLLEAVPALSKFHNISYDAKSRRVATSNASSSLVLHDIRSCKHQVIARGDADVTALCFSPDGRYLAVYSASDVTLAFWLTATSLFGMLQSQVKCVKRVEVSNAVMTSSSTSNTSLKSFPPKLVWINNHIVVLLNSDDTELRFHV